MEFSKTCYITIAQLESIKELGFIMQKVSIWRIYPTVDEIIDWLRIKYNIIIYNAIEPFVDPESGNKNEVLYRFAVKWCNRRDGWNGRVYIGSSKLSSNIYGMKREAIWLAIRWLKK